MDAVGELSLLCLQFRMSSVSVVFDFNASLNDVAPLSPNLLTVDLMRMENGGLFMDIIYVLFFFFHNHILWASASEPAGSVPSTQSQKREMGTIALWPHARACICVLFLLFSHLTLSFLSVVFNFNA